MTDTLVLSFQTRLSALMESLLKSTMMEVGRLVEESFLEEVQLLKGRLLLSEAKLRERERFRRLRCVDCCRTFTRRRSLHRGPQALTGLEPPACLKQEQVSDGCWKTNTPKDQEKPNEVNIPKADSEVKEEPVDAKDTQTCLLQAQTHNHSESPNGPEKTPGPRNPDPDLKPSGTAFSTKPEDEEHSTSAWLEAKGGSAAHSSGFHPEQIKTSSPPGSQALRQQSGQREEVVVMLPPDWEETSPVVPAHKSLKKAPRPGAAFSVGLVSYPQPLLKISPQAVQNLQPPARKNSNVLLPNVTPSHHRTIDANRVETVRKVPPAAKPPPVRQHTDGDDAEERTTHTCAQCGKSFSHLCHLRAHQQIHTGERQFCCSICGRNFTKLSNLKAHRRVHTGERPYFCTDCGKRFTQKCNLKRHQRIHLEMARSKL